MQPIVQHVHNSNQPQCRRFVHKNHRGLGLSMLILPVRCLCPDTVCRRVARRRQSIVPAPARRAGEGNRKPGRDGRSWQLTGARLFLLNPWTLATTFPISPPLFPLFIPPSPFSPLSRFSGSSPQMLGQRSPDPIVTCKFLIDDYGSQKLVSSFRGVWDEIPAAVDFRAFCMGLITH